MLIQCSEVIVELVLITKEFLEGYFILLERSIYGNVDADLLWLRLLAKYSINEYNLKRVKANSCIFFTKYYNGELELMMSVHLDYVFRAAKPETLKKTKENNNLKFNIQESRKVKNFLGVYYECGRDPKGTYAKMTMEEDVNVLIEGYKKYTGSDVKFQKTHGAPDTTISKSDLEKKYIYR